MIEARELTYEELRKFYDVLPPDGRFDLNNGGGQLALVIVDEDNEVEYVIPHASIVEVYFEGGILHIDCMSQSYTFSHERAMAFVAGLLEPYFTIKQK